jgi:hypothetical protein
LFDKACKLQWGDVMRGQVWLMLGIGMVFAATPASAQRYDPSYPVCMEVYGGDGSRIECFYTSMAQCKGGAGAGVAGLCFNNPYYVAPPPEPTPAVQTEPAVPATPAKPRRRRDAARHDAGSASVPAQKQP